ncbi:MAG: Transcriptional regulator, AraC family [Candidatus Eremiobacteraeota bacterium]|nr:Transcriptional regulator, AraC family [Candidatus Eremiobacteraeota bacterium]
MTADLIIVRSGVLDRLAALGIDLAHAFGRAGVPPSRFRSSKAGLTTREFFAFWHAVEALAGSPDVGLKLGAEAQPHQLDVASLAALHSPNLGEALTRVARYKRLCLPEEMRIDIEGGEVRIGFHWLRAEARLPPMLIDGAFAHLLALGHQGTGQPLTPVRVELARRRSNETMLKRHFACEVAFDAPADVLVLDESALARPFLTRNADLYEVLLPELEAALHERLGSALLAGDVKSVLRRSMSGERPSVEKVAAAMRMSPRTLQRRLAEQETSYQKLLDDVRDNTARRLLLDTDLDAGEIAFLLGFDELNSFTRAFHEWQGTTPIRWRQFHESRRTSPEAESAAALGAGPVGLERS